MDLFTRHYPEPGKEEDSAYYYWYRCMQLVEGYGPRHSLWPEFGDVNMPFVDWWIAHGEMLFMTGEHYGVWELKDSADIDQARKDGAYLLGIDPDCTREYLLAMFRDFLDGKQISPSAGRKRHSKEIKFARRGFAQRPSVQVLKDALRVWEYRQQNEASLYDTGCALNLCSSYVVKKSDPPDVKRDKRNKMRATVSRYERYARNLIKNVAEGVFPKYD